MAIMKIKPFIIIMMIKNTAILREKIPYSEKVNGNLDSIDTIIKNARNKPIPIQNKKPLQILYFLLSDLSASL